MQNDDDVASILADKYMREILSLLSNAELSAQQIATNLDIPTSTTYRKLKTLEDMTLIKKSKVIRTLEGLDESYYRSLVAQIDIQFKDGKMTYSIERLKMDDKIVRLWQKFKE